MDNLSGIKEYNYLYVNRTNNYPQNIGDTIVLSESYSKYHFINIEVVNSGIFREYFIPKDGYKKLNIIAGILKK